MLNYIQAEFYKVFHRKYTYIALGVFLLLEAILVASHVFHNAHSITPNIFGNTIIFLVELGSLGFPVCLLTADIVFAGQYKNSTLKNEVSFGLSRTQIYLGKLTVQTLLSIIYLVVMMGFFLGACAITLPIDPPIAPGETTYYSTPAADALIIVGYFLYVCFPLWVGAQAATCMCLFLIRSDMAAACTALGLTMVSDSIVEVIGLFAGGPVGRALVQISRHMPSSMISQAKSVVGDWAFLSKAWIVGAFWLVACTAIGLWGFHKKEIK